MQASTETFLHLILSPEEWRACAREFSEMAQAYEDLRWSEYPALDMLTDKIAQGH